MDENIGNKGGAPTPFVNSFAQPAVGSLRYNTSMAGSPLPIVYGIQRISVNLLEFWGYKGSSAKGGKGAGAGKSGNKKQASFSVNVALALCQGPVSLNGSSHGSGGNNQIFANAGVAFGVGAVGLNFFAGNDGQAADPVFVASDTNSPVLGYSGTAYVTGSPMQLGQSPALPNISFEVTGFLTGTSSGGSTDNANPSLIIADMMSNPRYGAGFPSTNIDTSGTLADYLNYCIANSLVISLLMDRQQPCARWIEEVCQLTVAAPFWSGALFKIVPYPTVVQSGNGVTWTPFLTPAYSVTDAELLDWGGESDPVITTRSDPTQATNWFGIEYYDSSNFYNPNIAFAFSQGAIDQVGLRDEPVSEGHLFTSASFAQASAQLQLNRKQLILNKYKFKLPWNFDLLDPMDLLTLTDVQAGLSNTLVRITSIEENDQGELEIEAEELPGITASQPLYNSTTPGSATPNFNATPPNVNGPIIFEPSIDLSNNVNQVWLLVSGQPPNWGGAAVYVSSDTSSYAYIGNVYAGGTQGLLTSSLASYGGANPDTINTLAIDVSESEGQLLTVSAANAAAGVTLCYVDGELLSYETATLTSANHYNLTTLYRGLYGTAAGGHSGGTQFGYIGLVNSSPGLLKYVYPSNFIGQTVHFKFVSFNQYLGETQDIGSVTPFAYVLTGFGSLNPFDVPISFAGIPQNGSPILNYTFARSVSFPANFSGSVCTAGVAATANTVFNIAKNGTNFATMTFAAAGSTATFAGSASSFVAGDTMSITPAATDATLANLTGNLAGTT